MAIHAGLRGRDAGEGRIFHAGVAIAAINATLGHVMLVTKRYRLRFDHADRCQVRRADYRQDQPAEHRQNEHRAEDGGAGDRVHAGVKYLRHRSGEV